LKLRARVEASDDYGLQTLRFHRGLNGVYSAPRIVAYRSVVRDSRETLEFPIGDLGVAPGDVISLFAEAVDTAPQPHLARSQTVRLQVITVEQYNDFLRERTDISDAAAKYEELSDDLQALIEQQQQLGAAAQKLGDKLSGANAPPSSESAQQLDALLARQNELNEKLNQQAARLEDFVRANPLYDVEREAQEALRRAAAGIRDSTRTNDDASRHIARQSMPASGGRSVSPDLLREFKLASDDQVQRLGGARESSERETAGVMEDMSRLQELIKDFNQFQALHQAQTALAQQAQAYNRPGLLSREDQLAMKDMAGTEKQVADLLDQLGGKLQSDAAAAEKLFPKAAASARDLAQKVERARIQPLAEQATGQMLAGHGEPSYQLAERVRLEMDKLFQECQGGNCPGPNELDQYLTLQRMSPGNNFAQMSRSRKFGVPGSRGMAGEPGADESGSSGYAVMDGSALSVLGNEPAAHRQSANSPLSNRFGHSPGAADKPATGIAGSDVVRGLNPVNRQSGAVSSETVIEEYNDVVEHYFKTITAQPKEQKHEH